MLTLNQRQEVIRQYRRAFKRRVHERKPWRQSGPMAEAFNACGDLAVDDVVEAWLDDADPKEVRDLLRAWRLENGLGLDQQELQLRQVA